MVILATKLYIPLPRRQAVLRPRLTGQLKDGLSRDAGMTLVSAPAGFGKTTLLGEWLALFPSTEKDIHVTWLSLDEEDNDHARFLLYLISALQKIEPTLGVGALKLLQVPQQPPTEAILTAFINDVAALPYKCILVLDDYHVLDSTSVKDVMVYLIDHLPSQLHLVIATREDPTLPLARLRARGQLNELRAGDLRFTLSEATAFLHKMMGLLLTPEEVAALESRTEGWVAGLQLAAISLQGNKDNTNFINSFTGSHRFVMDYLIEEVLQRQPKNIQSFLVYTSILDRLCGSLCDAVLQDPTVSGRDTLEYLESSNLFTVPLDNEGNWYRYHHLFSEFLRQQLRVSSASIDGNSESLINELHIRASQWYEDNGLDFEAFKHAAAGNDLERTERLIKGKGIPLYFREAAMAVLNWLESLPRTILDAKPSLWWQYASLLLINGQTTGVEEKLRAAEIALQSTEPSESNQNLVGQIALSRATLALTRYDAETMLAQSHWALKNLYPNNFHSRATACWTLGYAHLLSGDRVEARRAFTEAISLSQTSGDLFTTILSTIGLGNTQELDNQLYLAEETYQRCLKLSGDHPIQVLYEAYLGLGRIHYQWNDMAAAEHYGQQSLKLARQYEKVIDRFIVCEVFLAQLRLAEGDLTGANALLAEAKQSALQRDFLHRIPEIAAMQALTLIRQGDLPAASRLAEKHNLHFVRARIAQVEGNPSAGLMLLEPISIQAQAKAWADEQLKIKILEAILFQANGEDEKAVSLLSDALAMAEPGGFIRIFLDEGSSMSRLLVEANARGLRSDYMEKLLAAFEANAERTEERTSSPSSKMVFEPLSQRELDVLRLIAQGLTNQEISERLFLALDTIKNHNRRIFNKLQVQRRTEAIARARELRLI